ncbi:uncharacterized protein isoform X13 [Danio rerio]
MRTGDGPEKTGLWSSLYGMLVTHAGISVQQTEPALKLWAVFPLVSLPHGSSSIRPPSTTEELFSLQEEDGEPGNLTSLLFLLRINCDGLITIMKDFSPHFATGYSIHILFDTIVYTFTRHQRATEVFFFNSACCIKFY